MSQRSGADEFLGSGREDLNDGRHPAVHDCARDIQVWSLHQLKIFFFLRFSRVITLTRGHEEQQVILLFYLIRRLPLRLGQFLRPESKRRKRVVTPI